MRLFFDTEFIEDGKTIELISIGVVAEDGLTYYAENKDCDLTRANPWVRENVIPHLSGGSALASRKQIARELVMIAGDNPEWWGYFADYDWVVMCQLFGTMMDLPKNWPMYCRDVQQLADYRKRLPLPPQRTTQHNAMNDALWTRAAWRYAMEG